jgi:ABC-type glycerol-3-phosphate transport system substrate-binding protein
MKNLNVKRIVSILVVLCIIITTVFLLSSNKKSSVSSLLNHSSIDLLGQADKTYYYGNYFSEYSQKGAIDYNGKDISIEPTKINTVSSKNYMILEEYSKKQNVVLSSENGVLDYDINILQDGFYNLNIEYICKSGSIVNPERQILINDRLPFDEAFYVNFNRIWTESTSNTIDEKGNQIRGSQQEAYEYQNKLISDSIGFYKDPFRFYFSKGAHKLSIVSKEGDIVISSISLKAPLKTISYEQYENAHLQSPKQEIAPIKFESEKVAYKSSSSIRAEWTNDPISSPKGITNIVYNTFGGSNWQNGGDSATWEFDVSKDGLYTIAFRYAVPKSGFVSYRKIEIDKTIPFSELLEYPFTSSTWSAEKLISKENKPFLVYLTAGRHTITLTAVIGPLRQVVYKLRNVQNRLDLLFRQINLITASVKDSGGKIRGDVNRDYNLQNKIPDLISDLNYAAQELERCNEEIIKIGQGNTQQVSSSLMLAISTFHKMIADPELVPRQLNEFSNIIISLSNSATSLSQSPLYLDYMLLGSENSKIPKFKAGILDNTFAMFQSLINTFLPEKKKGEDEKTLNVWVARGRDWVQLQNQLTNDDFTQKTGIKVNFNVMPLLSDYMIITAYSGGKTPDIALGMGSTTPVEFAARDAVVNLKQFKGYESIVSQLIKNSTDCYTYNGGVYALPENADFQVLIYRKDIFDDIKLKVPQTFDDIYALLPILQENGMQFYYPSGPGGFTPFLFQAGGNYYTQDKTQTAIDSTQSILAFDEYTDLFNKYKMPLQADFFQRMRIGEMPIGIGSYDMYSKLLTSAPELSGKWAMALFPGHNGTTGIDRQAPSGTSAAIILNSSNKKEMAWEFLKWWMSAPTQERYGKEVQYLLGVGSQWNTANVDAIKNLGFKKEYLSVILKQWEFNKPVPVVPGSYYTDRQLLNAWNRKIISGESSRIALEDAAKEINKELSRKKEEFIKREGLK